MATNCAKHSYHGNQIFPKIVKKIINFRVTGLIFVTSKLNINFLIFEVVEDMFSGKCANFGMLTMLIYWETFAKRLEVP